MSRDHRSPLRVHASLPNSKMLAEVVPTLKHSRYWHGSDAGYQFTVTCSLQALRPTHTARFERPLPKQTALRLYSHKTTEAITEGGP